MINVRVGEGSPRGGAEFGHSQGWEALHTLNPDISRVLGSAEVWVWSEIKDPETPFTQSVVADMRVYV